MKIELIDGMILDKVKISLSFPLDIDESNSGMIEIHLEGEIFGINGWYSNVISLGELSSVLVEEDVVRVKFALAKMNSLLKIK